MYFEWDPEKARRNKATHKITFEEAASVFGDPLSITIEDPAHSAIENRYITLGRSLTGRIMVVIHTDRGDNIRVISARPATRSELKQYEEND